MGFVCDMPGLMPIEQAKNIIHHTIRVVTKTQSCALFDALGRVLAEDVLSSIDVPSYDNSAMDGYACRYDDLGKFCSLTQVGKSLAGNPYQGTVKKGAVGKSALGKGECIRIMTGALIPDGADTVVMQENTESDGDQIIISAEVIAHIERGDAIRLAGSDINKNSLVLAKGKRLTAIDIGLLASLGIDEVRVYRKVKVAVFSTGDELLAAGETDKKNRIFDSNRPMLLAMLHRLDVETIDLGIINDDKKRIQKTFELADSQADCVITSGGVSVGEADYTREVLEEIGTINFWKLAIKPGKPLAFGCLNSSLFFGLPGNPVSAAITFEQIAAPSLLLMAGCTAIEKSSLVAIAKHPFKKKSGRTDFQRAWFSTDESGKLWVEPSGPQSSGVLSSFVQSNCYAVLEKQRVDVEVGEQVSIQLFGDLID